MSHSPLDISDADARRAAPQLQRIIAKSGIPAVTRGFVRNIANPPDPIVAGAILERLVKLGIMEHGPDQGGQKTYRFKAEQMPTVTPSKEVSPPKKEGGQTVVKPDQGTVKNITSGVCSDLKDEFFMRVPFPHVGLVVSPQSLQELGEPFSMYTREALGAVLRILIMGAKVKWQGNVRVLTHLGVTLARELRRASQPEKASLPARKVEPPPKVVLPPPVKPSRPAKVAPPTPPVSPWENRRLCPTLVTFAFLAEWAKRHGVGYFNEDTFPRHLVYELGYSNFHSALQSARRLVSKGLVFQFLGRGSTLVFRADFLQEAEARGLLGDCPHNPLISASVAG